MNNGPTIKTLTELGLAENEAKLYDTLLKTTDATIPSLLKTTPFSRTLLYYLLGNLEGYGLITSEKKGSKTHYNAEPPEKLADMIQDREKEFAKQKDLLKNVMGDLYSAYRLAHNKPGVKFFEGDSGIREVTLDSLNATETIYTFADAEAIEKYGKTINQEYVQARLKKGIAKKIIALDTAFSREHYKNSISPLTEVRLIKANIAPFKTGMQVYNSTVSYSTLREDLKIAIIIVDPSIAQMQRSIFEYVWNTLSPF